MEKRKQITVEQKNNSMKNTSNIEMKETIWAILSLNRLIDAIQPFSFFEPGYNKVSYWNV